MPTLLYIHGMGGGGDSRIPAILSDEMKGWKVVVRTYSFDPEEASGQISAWVEELQPDVVAGESLGATHALAVRGRPHVFVSPAFGAGLYFGLLSPLTLVPGVRPLLERIYRPRKGDRQQMDFRFRTVRKYLKVRRRALENTPSAGSGDVFHAFFGLHDSYRRSGIVSIRFWKRHFGNSSHTLYDGTHFMEEPFVRGMLAEKIREFRNSAS